MKDQEALDAAFEAVKGYVDRSFAVVHKRLDDMETAVGAVRSLTYRGTYQRAESYQKNNCLTFEGALWIALKDNPDGKPGQSEDWQLAVKSGRDGKEVK